MLTLLAYLVVLPFVSILEICPPLDTVVIYIEFDNVCLCLDLIWKSEGGIYVRSTSNMPVPGIHPSNRRIHTDNLCHVRLQLLSML